MSKYGHKLKRYYAGKYRTEDGQYVIYKLRRIDGADSWSLLATHTGVEKRPREWFLTLGELRQYLDAVVYQDDEAEA